MFRHNPAICAAELDGEICLFHPATAEYLNLNATASAIWRLLAQPQGAEQLLNALLERYAVDPASCRQETQAFLQQALERGMLLQEG